MDVLRQDLLAAAARTIRAAVVIALTGVLVLAGSAAAHALPVGSDPAAGATLATGPTAVTITFGERPDSHLSTIEVLDANGNDVSAGPTTVVGSDGLVLTVPLQPLPTGVYTVAWRTVAADDGHVGSGSFAFGIGVTPPAADGTGVEVDGTPVASGSTGPAVGAILGRWLLLIGWLGLLGGAVFGLIIARPTAALYRGLLPVAWSVAVAGSLIVVVTQIADSGASPDEILGSSLGGMILLRGLPLVLAGIGVVLGSRAPGRTVLAVVALGAAVALVADVLLGHAAGSAGPMDVAVQTLHVIAVGLWLGGLAGLLLSVGRRATEQTARAARRFSWLATIGIGTVALTGTLRAVTEIGTLDGLLASDFGHLV
ncbi:MAG: copper transport protein, partial [Chloroflexota bacterium]|nr:copper transport protein [Chloroflexota bacterium]